MTRDEFMKKWVSYITYRIRDERDELLEQMAKDLNKIEALDETKNQRLIRALREIIATVTDGNTCRYIAREALKDLANLEGADR